MIEPAIRTEILKRLKKTEQEYNVRILMAIESGSRAWGFASPDSDYDVRFIYVHEKNWYASVDLEEKRDVIEYPIVDEIDLNGWDLRKALRLFWRSNPAFIEWIQSPITYIDTGIFRTEVSNKLMDIYSLDKGIYHYKHMATGNYRRYLSQDKVHLKKYFYTLRALFCINWILTKKTAPPIEFQKVFALVDDPALRETINDLLARKKNQNEKEKVLPIPLLTHFIEKQLALYEKFDIKKADKMDNIGQLNHLFHQILDE